MRGAFSFTSGEDIFIATDEHGSGISYSALTAASGFTSMNDVRNYLSQYYTDDLAYEKAAAIFIEHDGGLYFMNARAGFPRFDWAQASHEIVFVQESNRNQVVVETTVKHGYFLLQAGEFVTLNFYMYDGKIEYIEGGSTVFATLDSWAQGGDSWNEFAASFGDSMVFIAQAKESLLDLLDSFMHVHEMYYSELRILRGDTNVEFWGDTLIIWANAPMFEFEFIALDNDVIDENFVFIPTVSHGKIDVLAPGEAYRVNHYFGMGTLPWSGFTFLDENGNRHHFFMQHDNSDSPNWFIIKRFEPPVNP